MPIADVRVDLETIVLEKDLGVKDDQELKLSQHIERQVNNANKILGMIRRSYEFIESDTMKRLFTALVRPHLEFSNVAWAPRLIKDRKFIEGVQRHATKLVPDVRELPYEERLERMNIPSLKHCKKISDLRNLIMHSKLP